jgi:hypothetical protein
MSHKAIDIPMELIKYKKNIFNERSYTGITSKDAKREIKNIIAQAD